MMAAVAALEYVVWKEGREVVDLSEEFVNHMGKANWLHANWSDIERAGVRGRENQVGGTQGGAYLKTMADGLSVPLERDHPYRSSITYSPEITNTFWNDQFNTNTYNHDPANLPLRALQASTYYLAKGFVELPMPANPEAVERVLDRGYPVVFDCNVSGSNDANIWLPLTPAQVAGSHAMLIVGYDNRGANDDSKFFWVKNSWGPTTGRDGLVRVSYSYYRTQTYAANYITGFEKLKERRYELFGRWQLVFSGTRTLLDVSHIPGLADSGWVFFRRADRTDFRIGLMAFTPETTITSRTVVNRVNGTMRGRELNYYYDLRNRNFPYGARQTPAMPNGRLLSFRNGKYLVGYQQAGEITTPVIARRLQDSLPGRTPKRVNQLSDTVGRWQVLFDDATQGTLTISATSNPAENSVQLTIGTTQYPGVVRFANPGSSVSGVRFPAGNSQIVMDLRKGASSDTRVVTNFTWVFGQVDERNFAGSTNANEPFVVTYIGNL
jgi:hypothetical protein